MLKIIVLMIIVAFPVSVFAEPKINRAAIAQELTQKAKKAEVRVEFSVDPNDDTTLMLYRVSSLKPSELSGDWTTYIFSIGSTTEYLKEHGFNKVRIYTSKSKEINDYVLKIIE